ncbi:CDP-glycerol glycerophosphotransferase family protein [Oerskovia rustica]|uniref:CDP-glycerol glycerophosphotransferase family protein n=1 Tax=Oerskovia rustica TaxID=2762237 RepID=A0ABR8RT12_9CELL|nr:CDP-glycerol glycerophosphotransferase family protein [Oerskovia rustica]MBD7950942.1 CDP-glycerol glycerophosphotransferase family protein [Oerskovia rustica]
MELLKTGKIDAAEQQFASAVELNPGQAEWQHKLGFVQERKKRFETALGSYLAAIALRPGVSEWHYRAGRCLQALHRRDEAVGHFETALQLDPSNKRAAREILASVPTGVPAWRKLDLVARAARTLTDENSILALARAASAMRDHKLAASEYAKYHQITSGTAQTHLSHGLALEGIGQVDEAVEEYRVASRLDTKHDAATLGPGALFQAQGDWEKASEWYMRSWNEGNRLPLIAFKAAYALDRQYRWEEAIHWFNTALVLEPEKAYWNYKLAHALERNHEYELAADAYSRALEIGQWKQNDWAYRLGFCLDRIGAHKEAFVALLAFARRPQPLQLTSGSDDESSLSKAEGRSRSLQHQLRIAEAGVAQYPTSPESWLRHARLLSEARDPERSIHAFARYRERANEIELGAAADHAQALASGGDYVGATDVLLAAREFSRPDGIPLDEVLTSTHKRRRALYAEYWSRHPVNNRVVMFESYWGEKISCNPLAMYKAMIRDDRYRDALFVWTVKSDTSVPEALLTHPRTVLASYGSELYIRMLATAGTLINNTSFVEYFARRPEQKYLNLWHGTPIKAMGKHIKSGIMDHANVARNFLNTTHIFAPNEHTRDALVNDYDISGLYSGSAIATGSPRLDQVVGANRHNSRAALLQKLGLPVSPTSQIVFYAPTWRGSPTDRTVDVAAITDDLTAMARTPDTHVLFRMHHLVENQLEGLDLPAIQVPEAIDTYEVMGAADVLVTDFSSLMFDFLVTNRRVIIYAPDIDTYAAQRGLYFHPSQAFDDICTDRTSLVDLLSSHDTFTPGPRYRASRQKYVAHEDGNAAQRCIDLLYSAPKPSLQTAEKVRLVFYASLIPNGITTSLISLLKTIDREKYEISLIVEPDKVAKDEGRAAMLRLVPEDVMLIGRQGVLLATPEEQWVIDRFTHTGQMSFAQRKLFDAAYEREHVRVLGTPLPAVYIEFEGYSLYWMSLFSVAHARNGHSIAFMHSQMLDESLVRFPRLARIFRLYRRFDQLAAVSGATATLNQATLGALGHVRPGQVSTVHNALDWESIQSRAKEELPAPVASATASRWPVIVTVGRLSTEKNQADIIHAVQTLRATYPRVLALIVGSGPMESSLEATIQSLGLADHVRLTGQLANPMPLVALADVFTLTSLHEGQPMVLFEAMTLGTPIVTYPSPGILEATHLGYGSVVKPNSDDLAAALVATIEHRGDSTEAFVAPKYNATSKREFDALVQCALKTGDCSDD